ncbi:MAG TPA: 16S rRNA (guanine(527)-N(7))-methyltransferase RsmG [Myxococcota bacterium]|nr:16S rRNA (guanine(527)-N(7))-methyltransferase RsmG [Myxococcota bacterium]
MLYKNLIEGKIAEVEASSDFCQAQIGKIEKYTDLIRLWSATHNIVSKQLTEQDLWENIYDSIFALSQLKSLFFSPEHLGDKIIDAGAGGGFPGIPLSIIFATKRFVLIDSDRKKCSFLRAAKANLGLDNVSVVNKRLEDLEPVGLIVTKAAFSPSHAGTLAMAAKKGASIIIWSLPKSTHDFVAVLQNHDCVLSQKIGYTLPGEKERSILVFSKL